MLGQLLVAALARLGHGLLPALALLVAFALFAVLEVLLDERLKRDPKTLALDRLQLTHLLAKRLGAELVDQPRLPANGLLQILQPLLQFRDGLRTVLKPFRNLSAFSAARDKNKHQGDKPRHHAQGDFRVHRSTPGQASEQKRCPKTGKQGQAAYGS